MYLLCAIDLFSKYAWVVSLKIKEELVFPKIISEGRKPNKIWLDQGGEFYNKLFIRFLKINEVEMYSTYNEGISIDAGRFFRRMTSVSKNVYFDGLDDLVDKCNNTVQRSIKMKPIDITSDSYAKYNKDSNEKDPKFKVCDHVKISKYKNIFAKG